MKIDFHVHTNASIDTLTRPEDIAKKSISLGVIPAITDHNSISSNARMRALGAAFIPGEEIFTSKGDLIGLYLNEAIKKNTQFLEAIDLIHSQGGIAYLPHMYDRARSGRHASEEEAAQVDVIEVFNARCMDQRFNEKALGFALKHGMLQGAGSDCHHLFEFGSSYVELPDFDIENPKALLKSLKKGRITGRPTTIFARGATTAIATARRVMRKAVGQRQSL
jgi:predicted metal-dependent phosphoesterase TrpH